MDRQRAHRALDRLLDKAAMYRIKVYRSNGKRDVLVAEPKQTFEWSSEIEDFMDKNYPGCWYSTIRL